jgi:hypothetical protein
LNKGYFLQAGKVAVSPPANHNGDRVGHAPDLKQMVRKDYQIWQKPQPG